MRLFWVALYFYETVVGIGSPKLIGNERILLTLK